MLMKSKNPSNLNPDENGRKRKKNQENAPGALDHTARNPRQTTLQSTLASFQSANLLFYIKRHNI